TPGAVRPSPVRHRADHSRPAGGSAHRRAAGRSERDPSPALGNHPAHSTRRLGYSLPARGAVARGPAGIVTDARCPLCGADAPIWFHKRGCTIRRCAQCTLVFTAGTWPTAQARSFYGAPYFSSPQGIGYANYAGLEAALRATAEERLRGLPMGGRLLDIGC